jgi:hypothetical protein
MADVDRPGTWSRLAGGRALVEKLGVRQRITELQRNRGAAGAHDHA